MSEPRVIPEEKVVWLGNDMAYPVLDRDQTPNGTYQLGLTKRELFAAMAMQGMLACDRRADLELAEKAVIYADALLKELAK